MNLPSHHHSRHSVQQSDAYFLFESRRCGKMREERRTQKMQHKAEILLFLSFDDTGVWWCVCNFFFWLVARAQADDCALFAASRAARVNKRLNYWTRTKKREKKKKKSSRKVVAFFSYYATWCKLFLEGGEGGERIASCTSHCPLLYYSTGHVSPSSSILFSVTFSLFRLVAKIKVR